jgi:Outer membrane protein beta-barrel domain
MKKWLLFMIILIFCTATSAQVLFGVKAGVNLSNMFLAGATTTQLNYKIGFNSGLMASIPLFSTFYLQPEVVYSEQGYQYNQLNETSTLNCNYINVPVLFKFKHDSGLFAETGPQIGFLLSAKNENSPLPENAKSLLYTTDFSWAFGIGYELPNIHLGIDTRYNLGLFNVENDNGGETLKNSVFQFGLFYLLNVRHSRGM